MPWKVKAAIAETPHSALHICEVDVADPGPDDVAVRLLATGICHSDLHALEDNASATFPLILGHEGIGDVVAIGAEVTGLNIGDRVIPYLVPDCGECPFCRSGRTNLCVEMQARMTSRRTPFSRDGQPIEAFLGLGTFAEMTVVHKDMVVKVNAAARPDHACCIGCGVTTGIGAATITTQVQPGSSVAVLGVGGVGLSVVQGARMAGANRIIAVDRNPAKRDIALELGATDFIDASVVADPAADIRAITGLGAEFAFECVGQPALFKLAVDCTNPAWGTVVTLGVFPKDASLSVSPMAMMMGRRWVGSFMGGAKRSDVAQFVDRYVAGEFSLDRLVSHRLAHSDINDGFAMMKDGRSVRSVVIY